MPSVPATAGDCKNGGYQESDFKNQGQCVSSIRANQKAGKE